MAKGRAGSVRAVSFDLVGTLIEGRRGIGEQYAGHARLFGAAPDARRVEAALRRAFLAAPSMAFPGRAPAEIANLERQWWRTLVGRVVEQAGFGDTVNGPVFEAYFERLYDHFTTAEAWRVCPDAVEALTWCRKAGLAVGLITNYDHRVHAVLEATGLAPLIDSVTIPAMVGSAKPSRAIFEHALAALGVPAAAALHVGDSLEDDYQGAIGAGMGAALVDRTGRYRGVSGIRRIESLLDLAVQTHRSTPSRGRRTPRRTGG